MYRKRWIGEKVREALKVFPVIVITGARQTGKTTFLLNEEPFKNWRYLNFDSLDTLSYAKREPESLIIAGENIAIDEVQRAPEILFKIKELVDKNPDMKFILSGSANILLMRSVSESLSGRGIYFDLLPFALGEWERRGIPEWFFRLFDGYIPKERKIVQKDVEDVMLKGFMPRVLKLDLVKEALLWWEGYTKTYIERDLRDIAKISYLSDYRRLMEILSLRVGSLINETEVSKTLGISQPTIHRYINLLEVSNLYIKLKPYLRNPSKRLVKTPKGYFIDPGLTYYLSKQRENISREFLGHIFENMIFLHLKVLSSIVGGELYYWRYRGGIEREVDFIFCYKNRVIPMEVKFKEKVKFKDLEGIELFMEKNKDTEIGIVIYSGNHLEFITKNVLLVPWSMIC